MTTERQATIGMWVAIATLGLGILTGGTAWLAHGFANKDDLHAATDGNDVRDWRLHTLEVRVTNLELRSERIDKNVERLNERFRVTSAPEPTYQPLPPKPEPAAPKDE